ncbi:hypothetical protein VTI74DRAFT_7468 [Chaetomium olivicolor]
MPIPRVMLSTPRRRREFLAGIFGCRELFSGPVGRSSGGYPAGPRRLPPAFSRSHAPLGVITPQGHRCWRPSRTQIRVSTRVQRQNVCDMVPENL